MKDSLNEGWSVLNTKCSYWLFHYFCIYYKAIYMTPLDWNVFQKSLRFNYQWSFTRRVLQLVPQYQCLFSHFAHMCEKQMHVTKSSEWTILARSLPANRKILNGQLCIPGNGPSFYKVIINSDSYQLQTSWLHFLTFSAWFCPWERISILHSLTLSWRK